MCVCGALGHPRLLPFHGEYPTAAEPFPVYSVLILSYVILTCTFGLLLPYPTRFYMLFGKYEELPTLPLAVLEWQ